MKIPVPRHIQQLVSYLNAKPPAAPGANATTQAHLSANENPLGLSPKAAEAIKNNLAHIHRYPDGTAEKLREALAARLSLPPEWILCGNGSDEIMDLAVRVFLRGGEEGIFVWPSFVIYRLLTQSHGGVPVAVPLRDFRAAPDAILGRVTARTRIVFLASPNNPTGLIVPKADLLQLLAEIPETVLVILDEAYAQFVRDPQFPDAAELVRQHANLLVLRSFSKFYGLAGVRIGYGIGQAELVSVLDRVRLPYNVNTLAQVAALAALSDPVHEERTNTVVHKGLDYLYGELGRLGVRFLPSEANFILVDARRDAGQVALELAASGVDVRPMGDYGLPTHLRVSVGLDRENEMFVAALTKALHP